MKLSEAQVRCLKAIRDGRGDACLSGYRFSSAAVLDRNHLIAGDHGEPYWRWKLTDQGRWVANLNAPQK
jgi:hypothetical protein